MNNHILTDLIHKFNPAKLDRFFREKNNQYKPVREDLTKYDDEAFTNGLKLGEINFDIAEQLILCAFQVQQPLSERSGKKAQYDKAKKILQDFQSDAGIFVFYDESGNFRFSLVYANYLGKKRDWSTFRRFTYFVSPELTNKTFLQRIGEGDFSSLDSIKDVFSVEKVTNKFFEEFRELFGKTKEEFEKTNKNTVCLWLKSKYDEEEYQEQVNKFTFTFLGRIIFLYFLLRKGWIEDKSDYIRKIIEDKTQSNFYRDVFEPLFFEVFAKKEDERPLEIRQQYKNTPYLNGGLFEHSDLEAEMARESRFIFFEDSFIRDIILNFFEAYNFTVDENSPNDQEVSIDPEMLGKVFENTLAEEERNKKGTFYTPREVVHFMVKDALRQFLHNETGIDLPVLQRLIYDEDVELNYLTPNQIRQIDAGLEGIKVLDPAVGSAAFPVEMMQVLIELRKRLNVRVGRNINEVSLKKQFIKNNLYGVDIDSGAIEIAKLRLWLALIVDYDKTLAEPLPNLDFQFRVGNSLQEKIDEIDIFNETNSNQMSWLNSDSEFEKKKKKMIEIKDRFYLTTDETERRDLKNQFDDLEHELIQAVLKQYRARLLEQKDNKDYRNTSVQLQTTLKKIERLEQQIKDGTYKLFKPDFHFSEVFDREDQSGKRVGGFDIVIGNPPYGVSVDNDIRDWHNLGSRDSYGVFISTALKRFLKPGGVLEFIVSDTWLTIKTHKPLREQVLENRLHKVVRLHQDCFEATVNPCVFSLSKQPGNSNPVIAADLTNISTRKEIAEMRRILYSLEAHIGQSTPRYAVYEYDQKMIRLNSNLPIFVGSPKLFRLLQDTGVKTIRKVIAGKVVPVRQVEMNGQTVELVRFGDVADVKQGLATGDNKAYLYQNPEAYGSYRNIEEYRQYLLTEKDLEQIAGDEERRMKVVEYGIHRSRSEKGFDEDRWFGGRYIAPYDKGGASDTDSGWLPNYYVPTDYYIDWSSWAINRMRTYTIAQRIIDNKENKTIKPHYRTQIAAVFRNTDTYFRTGITFSDTGFYAPTFRINSSSIYDVMGMTILTTLFTEFVLAVLCSKLCKYFIKNFINHSVHTQVEGLKPIPFTCYDEQKIINLVKSIIVKQKENFHYDYMSNEQKEIDRLVYELYGLNEADVREVETWYARRYPKLAQWCDTD